LLKEEVFEKVVQIWEQKSEKDTTIMLIDAEK
jgi:hypothetical protein